MGRLGRAGEKPRGSIRWCAHDSQRVHRLRYHCTALAKMEVQVGNESGLMTQWVRQSSLASIYSPGSETPHMTRYKVHLKYSVSNVYSRHLRQASDKLLFNSRGNVAVNTIWSTGQPQGTTSNCASSVIGAQRTRNAVTGVGRVRHDDVDDDVVSGGSRGDDTWRCRRPCLGAAARSSTGENKQLTGERPGMKNCRRGGGKLMTFAEDRQASAVGWFSRGVMVTRTREIRKQQLLCHQTIFEGCFRFCGDRWRTRLWWRTTAQATNCRMRKMVFPAGTWPHPMTATMCSAE